jgi:hypothetical protein
LRVKKNFDHFGLGVQERLEDLRTSGKIDDPVLFSP